MGPGTGDRAWGDAQSVLEPLGPEAELIADLTWVLFIGGGIIFLATMLLLAVAIRGGDGPRRILGSRRFILWAGVAFPVVVLSALLVGTLRVSAALDNRPMGAEPLKIEVIGRQFWWEVRYPGTLPSGGIVTANEIHIPVGREVELRVSAGDVYHSLWIPTLHGKIDMVPGRTNTLRLRAARPGVVRGQCTEFCGAQHALMAFYVVAETPDGYERWLERHRLPAAEPVDEFLATGRKVFAAAGCGGCHAVRGTEWDARIGPDLTHVGSRLSLAAGTLDNHRGTLGGWIAGVQDLKPGANMPSYNAVLDGRELRAVSAWLESLR
ncbi:c-type cytochrome [Roseomonas sp. SSH11]|uniref:C-type cytochrome n=1 Tax=Pararoseomonas baculiformis TaxID=2820812 RepID=A0ABS4AKZ6_9PROT|nr:c-type cytochrome [Pararoseomonas baculiformis]